MSTFLKSKKTKKNNLKNIKFCRSLQNNPLHSPTLYGSDLSANLQVNSLFIGFPIRYFHKNSCVFQNFWACPPNLLDESGSGFVPNHLMRHDKQRCHSVSPSRSPSQIHR